MAVTRIWAIRGYVGNVISYASNKNKTDFSKLSEDKQALLRSLHYAENEDKTKITDEQKLLVEGINCDHEFAAEQMMNTKELYGKTDGIVAYHAYISFKPDEVSPKEAQKIAMETATEMWGCGSPVETSAQQKHRPSREARQDYEVVVATHMNAHCVHCHIVINSVSMTDGKKMNENHAMYRKFREVSDRKCLEHGLSVIENPRGKRVPYNVYKAQQKGIKTKYDYIREDIDSAISHNPNVNYFLAELIKIGYVFDNFYDPNRYATIRQRGDEHGIRLVNLGEEYTPIAIQYRIKYQDKKTVWMSFSDNNRKNNIIREEFMTYRFKGAEFYESKYIYENDYEFNQALEYTVKAITGCILSGCPVIALLFIGLLFAGALLDEYNRNPHPKSPSMRLSKPRIEFMSKQMDLALKEKFYSFEDVEKFIISTGTELEKLKYERSKIYNKIRRCTDPEQKEKLILERNRLTGIITEKRTDLNIAKRIISDRPDLEARTNEEKKTMNEWYFMKSVEIPTPPKSRYRDNGAR